jgi:hypothetical protein
MEGRRIKVTKSSVGVELIKVQYPYHLNTKANKEE